MLLASSIERPEGNASIIQPKANRIKTAAVERSDDILVNLARLVNNPTMYKWRKIAAVERKNDIVSDTTNTLKATFSIKLGSPWLLLPPGCVKDAWKVTVAIRATTNRWVSKIFLKTSVSSELALICSSRVSDGARSSC